MYCTNISVLTTPQSASHCSLCHSMHCMLFVGMCVGVFTVWWLCPWSQQWTVNGRYCSA